MESTDSIRELAPRWSLAGDEILLKLLENTHKRIISQCDDINKQLVQMATELDDASIDLQNVNNRFMGLSNSQFIESRVYEDDTDIHTQTHAQQVCEPAPLTDELSTLKSSLSILEQMHESTEIIDDEDSDSDNEISVVLKPRCVYSHRPLPCIIGTQPWRDKWHAGLVLEGSESESGESSDSGSQQYSHSEHEEQNIIPGRHISESSSAPSERDKDPSEVRRGAQLVADIARRHGATHPPPAMDEDDIPQNVIKNTYKPNQPVVGTIFSDEPPPLDHYDSEESYEDIFEEINRNKPYNSDNKAQNTITNDLFAFKQENTVKDDIFSDFIQDNVQQNIIKPKSTLFDEQNAPDLSAPTTAKEEIQHTESSTSKKPIGGISLFGSNKDSQNIGAAILNRNRRHSSSSDSDSNVTNQHTDFDKLFNKDRSEVDKINKQINTKNNNEYNNTNNDASKNMSAKENIDTGAQKDIFKDIFSKESKKGDAKRQNVKSQSVKKESVKPQNVKDIFSDNLFDDIDDIFTTNIEKKPKTSIFNETEDLFSDVAKPVSKPKEKSSLFDSDDELFSDVKVTSGSAGSKVQGNKAESLFSDASIMKSYEADKSQQSDKTQSGLSDTTQKIDALFGEASVMKDDQPISQDMFDNVLSDKSQIQQVDRSHNLNNANEDIDDGLFSGTSTIIKDTITPTQKKTEVNKFKVKSIFDSDSDSDIFDLNKNKTSKVTSKFHSPSLFDDDDDLFGDKVLSKTTQPKPENTKVSVIDNLQAKKDSNEEVISTEINSPLCEDVDNFEQTKIDADAETISTLMDSQDSIPDSQEKNKINNTLRQEIESTKFNETDLANENQESTINIKSSVDIAKDSLLPKQLDPDSNKPTPANNEENITKEKESLNPTLDTDLFNKQTENKHIRKDIYTTEQNNKAKDIKNTIEDTQNWPLDVSSESFTSNEPKIQEDLADKLIENEGLINEEKNNESPILRGDNDKENLSLKTERNSLSNDSNISENVLKDEEIQEKLTSTSNPQSPLYNEDIFSSILTEPPDMVKKEIKKNKNVNALFDDSSDDDAILTRSDVITDEKPNVFGKSANFGIFSDEPPDLDVCDDADEFGKDIFGVKDKKGVNVEKDNLFASKLDKGLFSKKDDGEISSKKDENEKDMFSNKDTEDIFGDNNFDHKNLDKKDELFTKYNENPNITNVETDLPDFIHYNEIINKDISTVEENMIKTDVENTKTTEVPEPEKQKDKKIGKINSKININIQALMPGASPKKVKQENENVPKMSPPEIETSTTKPVEPDFENIEPKIVKSISFDSKIESEVLDNNLSKKRAKIQVKRRPSSRKARHEAVRKSVLDLDSDNSSSLDEPRSSSEPRSKGEHLEKSTKNTDDIKPNLPKASEKDLEKPKSNENEALEQKSIPENHQKQSSKEQKTKIVYVLNDEDIFTNKNEIKKPKSLFDDLSDDDDLFGKNKVKIDQKADSHIKTSDSQTKSVNITKTESQINVESTIETATEIKSTDTTDGQIKTTNISQIKVDKKQNINKLFDSDSDDDLFKKPTVFKNVTAASKKPLFEDVDLFGETRNQALPKPSSSKEQPKPVFNDPLSLFDDD